MLRNPVVRHLGVLAPRVSLRKDGYLKVPHCRKIREWRRTDGVSVSSSNGRVPCYRIGDARRRSAYGTTQEFGLGTDGLLIKPVGYGHIEPGNSMNLR